MTQEIPEALMAIGACSLEDPQPKFLFATIISPGFTRLTKPASISSIHFFASSFGSEEFRYLAGIITSVSTLSPYLCTVPNAFIDYTSFLLCPRRGFQSCLSYCSLFSRRPECSRGSAGWHIIFCFPGGLSGSQPRSADMPHRFFRAAPSSAFS